MTYFNAGDAVDAFNDWLRINGDPSPSQLKFKLQQIISEIAVRPTAGNPQVFLTYSGGEGSMHRLAESLVNAAPNEYAYIDDTIAGRFIENGDVKVRLNAAFAELGIASNQSAINVWMNGTGSGTPDGIWDTASLKYAQNAYGDVVSLILDPREASVFEQIELRNLLENPNVRSINGIERTSFKAVFDSYLLKHGTADALSKMVQIVALQNDTNLLRGLDTASNPAQLLHQHIETVLGRPLTTLHDFAHVDVGNLHGPIAQLQAARDIFLSGPHGPSDLVALSRTFLDVGDTAKILKNLPHVAGVAGLVLGGVQILSLIGEVNEAREAGDEAKAQDAILSFVTSEAAAAAGTAVATTLAAMALAAAGIGLATPPGWIILGATAIVAGFASGAIGDFYYNTVAHFWKEFGYHLAGGDLADWLEAGAPLYQRPIDPLILDLDGDGLDVIALTDSSAHFDLNANGLAERTAWLSGDDGFLAVDANNNGIIDDISELFGDSTRDGFAELDESDANHDGVIDAKDAIFAKLVVWRDLDGDGLTDAGELQGLQQLGITHIGLHREIVNGQIAGNLTTEVGEFTRADGTVGQIADIWFQNDQVHTLDPRADEGDISAEAAVLPRLSGFGTVRDLALEISDRADLALAVRLVVEQSVSSTLQQTYLSIEQVILKWAQVEATPVGSRGDVNAQHLAFLEAVHGTTYLNAGPGTVVTGVAAAALENYYQRVMGSFVSKFAAQVPSSAASVLDDGHQMDANPLALVGAAYIDKLFAPIGLLPSAFDLAIESLASQLPQAGVHLVQLDSFLLAIEQLQLFSPRSGSSDSSPAAELIAQLESTPALDADTAAIVQAIVSGAQVVSGGDAADSLVGRGAADEIFIARKGDDLLTGGDGNDTYVWRPGDGDDTIVETGESWSDLLHITDVPASDVTLHRDQPGGEILITIAETAAHAGGSILLPQGTGIELLRVAGTTMLLTDAFHVLGTDVVLTEESDSWGGGDYVDAIDGAEGDDYLWGGTGDDRVLGGAGNDYVSGQDGNDIVSGGNGDDSVYGDAGDDVLTGGAGSDTVDGGEGNDTFVWSRGDGNDAMTDGVGAWYSAQPAGIDVLRLHDVQPGHVRLVTYSNDTNSVVVLIEESAPGAGDGASLTLTNSRTEGAVEGAYAGIESIEFDDGTVWDRGTIEQAWFYMTGNDSNITGTVRDDHIFGGSGEDSLSGWDGNDTISGGAGNDYLSGDDGDDTLTGGAGDDTLSGGVGDDTFIYSRGDGNDTISDHTGYDWAPSPAGTDVLVLHGVLPSQVTLVSYSTDLNAIVLTIAESAPNAGDGGTLTLRGSRADDGQGTPFAGVDSVVFDDGTVWDRSVLEAAPVFGTASDDYIGGSVRADDISAGAGNDTVSGDGGDDTIRGGAGDDTIYGSDGDDIVIGGGGNDYLDGGAGNDTFVWSRGDGSDTIYDQDGPEWAAIATGVDVLRLDGVLPSQVTLAAYSTNMNAIVLTIAESATGQNDGGTLTLMGSRYDEGTGGPYAGIDSIVFGDGTVWDRNVIEAAPVFGTAGADTIIGSTRDDRMSAGAGDDYVIGDAGADVLDGGAGTDVLTGGDGDDALIGGTGDDTLYGDAGADTITGGAGTDWMDGNDGDDTFVWSRGDGNDTIADQSPASSGPAPAGYDVLRLHGVLPSQVTLAAYSTDMNAVTLLIAESSTGAKDGGTITLPAGRYDEGTGGPYAGVDAVIFDDGTVWDRAKLESAPISGTTSSDNIYGSVRDDVISAGSGDDYVYGDAGADVIDGGAGNDSLTGGDGNDTITGGAGNDSLWGDAGNDTLTGGLGTDVIEGGDGDDTFVWSRGDGSDTLSDNLGSTWQPVPAGFDVLRLVGVTPNQVTLTTLAADHFTVVLTILESVSGKKDGGVLTLQSSRYHESTGPSAGIDSIVFADGTTWDHSVIEHAVLNGTSSADTISGTVLEDVIAAGSGNDVVYADAGNDSIDGGAGNDTVYAGEGNDVLIGGTGNDSLYGEAGDDTITGGVGTDILDGGDGDDTFIWARGDGSDTISDNNGSTASPIPAGTDVLRLTGILPSQVTLSTSSNDLNSVILTIAPSVSGATDGGVLTLLASRYDDGTPGPYAGVDRVVFSDGTVWDHATFLRAPIIGTSAADTIYGTVRDDSIDGGAGNDTIYGDAGNDTLIGNTGNDTLYGDAGNDTLTGGAGTDTLYGGDGNDTLNGGDSNDSLTGGAGNDVLTGGGTSVDTFVFNFGDTGVDRVTDFGAVAGTNHDYLRLIGFNTNFSTVVAGAVEDSAGTHLHITPDLEILLEGVHKTDLSTDDFKWS